MFDVGYVCAENGDYEFSLDFGRKKRKNEEKDGIKETGK
jgi:hypothetical protein